MTKQQKSIDVQKDNKLIFIGMLIGSIASLIASFVLSIEALVLAGNPDAQLTCSINAVLNCASVALHPSAELLGFPNAFIGMIVEPVVITVAIAGLAGVKFPRLFMFFAQIGYTLGFIFAWVLFYISFVIIQALCPWCLLVTLTTTLVFFSMTRYNIREENLYLPAALSEKLKSFIRQDYDKLLLAVVVVGAIAAILTKYGSSLWV